MNRQGAGYEARDSIATRKMDWSGTGPVFPQTGIKSSESGTPEVIAALHSSTRLLTQVLGKQIANSIGPPNV
ncbi:MAG: hypothetical protein GDA36_08555 [Rhodobacteraceae bacterium]|nr:hypothetical protein [Paracoccaceae bacterium]